MYALVEKKHIMFCNDEHDKHYTQWHGGDDENNENSTNN